MKVEIDSNSGFCLGVINAIHTAESHLANNETLYCLGDIVHNNEEVNRLTTLGLKVISYPEFEKMHDVTVLIRAHGEPPSTYQLAKKNNITIIDSTCKVVLGLQKKIRNLSLQNPSTQILIFGKEGHAEVIGLMGQIPQNGIVISSSADLYKINFTQPAMIFSQTTQSLAQYNSIISEIQNSYSDHGNPQLFQSFDTVCRSVANRTNKLQLFAAQYDKVIFVSGEKSSNGLYLFDICKSVNPNTFLISHINQVEKVSFSPTDKVGICGATSTPMWLMQRIKKIIEKL